MQGEEKIRKKHRKIKQVQSAVTIIYLEAVGLEQFFKNIF